MVESVMHSKCSSHDLNSYSSENFEVLDNGYEGAVVIEPKEGIYLNEPIVVFDYGSLYPSSMISCNLSHDCNLMDEKYHTTPGRTIFLFGIILGESWLCESDAEFTCFTSTNVQILTHEGCARSGR
jgi:DNA polymerase elongation subunit (family B)